MMRPPTSGASGLSLAPVELIKLLAEIAVRDYLAELEYADEEPGHEPEALTKEASR